MPIDPSRHAQNRPGLENLLRTLPGFRGYLEKEYRRESDALQRQWLADRFQQCKRTIDQVTRSLAEAGQLDLLPQMDRLRGRLDHLIARVRGAMQGYSGFFDLVRVDEPFLERIYSYDAGLLEQGDTLAQAVEQLPADSQKLAAALPGVHQQIDALERAWDERENLLRGLDQTPGI